MKNLTKPQRRDVRAIAARKDEDIDFADVPPILDWSQAEIGKFYGLAKKPVTLCLDSDIIASLKYLSDLARSDNGNNNKDLRHSRS